MISRLILGTALSTIAFSVVGCGLYDPEPFDPRSFQEPYRENAANVQTQDLPPLPTTLQPAYPSTEPTPTSGAGAATEPSSADFGGNSPTTGPALGSEPIVYMSLEEIVHRAVANNHDVHVAGFGPSIEGTRVTEADARFDPDFFMNTDFEHKNELTAGQVFTNPVNLSQEETSNVTQSDIYTFQTGIKQNLPSGAQVQLQYQAQYQYLLPRVYIQNPFYDNSLTLQVTQPLLRDFGYEVNQARIVIARDNQKVSLLDFRKQIEDTCSDIEKNYWQLDQATRDVRTFENLLDITAQTYNILQRRFKNNVDVSKLELNQAQTSLEERRAELIQAKNRVRDFSDKIKELMADPEFPVTSPALIQPSDQPVEEPLNFDVSDQINTGLENRLELAQEIYKIDLADITAQVGKNNLLPQFNLVGSIGNQGEGNNEGDAFRNQWTFGHIDYGIGFQFEYPLGNRAAEAIWKRTLLQRMQEIERYRSFIDQVSYDVKVAINDEQSAWEQIIATRESRLAADAALANIHDREKAGEPLTPTFVQLKLDLQDRLANAEQQEHAAISQYNVSILQLERSKGTLLKYLNVVMEESPDLFPTKKWMAHHQSELQN